MLNLFLAILLNAMANGDDDDDDEELEEDEDDGGFASKLYEER